MGMKTIGRFIFDNTTPAPVAAGANIPLLQSTTSNKCVSCDGNTITINKAGVYQISANFTFTATAVGVIETMMYRAGNAVPGAYASDTATTIGNNTSQSFNAIVTVPQNAPILQLNFKATNATSVRNANVIVIKVA